MSDLHINTAMDRADAAEAECARLKTELQAARGGWIAVADRLPEANTDVLVWVRGGHYWIGFLDAHGWWNSHSQRLVPTHWRPLPAPPEATT